MNLRIRRLFFAFSHYKYLKKCWGIKFPIFNALFGTIHDSSAIDDEDFRYDRWEG